MNECDDLHLLVMPATYTQENFISFNDTMEYLSTQKYAHRTDCFVIKFLQCLDEEEHPGFQDGWTWEVVYEMYKDCHQVDELKVCCSVCQPCVCSYCVAISTGTVAISTGTVAISTGTVAISTHMLLCSSSQQARFCSRDEYQITPDDAKFWLNNYVNKEFSNLSLKAAGRTSLQIDKLTHGSFTQARSGVLVRCGDQSQDVAITCGNQHDIVMISMTS